MIDSEVEYLYPETMAVKMICHLSTLIEQPRALGGWVCLRSTELDGRNAKNTLKMTGLTGFP